MNGILVRSLGAFSIAAGLLVVLGGCNGTTSSTPNNGGGGSPPPRNSRVYVTDASGNLTSNPNSPDTIDVFTISSIISGGASGISPIQQIMSSSFASAFGIAVDSSANIYVADKNSSAILVFRNNASGTGVAPFRTITSSAMVGPVGIALDASNNIYVAVPTGGSGAGAILEFSSTQSGSVTPIRQITGGATGLNQPTGVALHNGNIYVTNNASSTVEVFLSTASNNSTPARVISGASSGLSSPFGIVVDPSGNIYVSNFSSSSSPGSITVYGPSRGSTPIRTITASSSQGLIAPAGLALDASNNLYVALGGPPSTSSPTGELVVYGPGANGAASPISVVTGVGFATWGVAVF